MKHARQLKWGVPLVACIKAAGRLPAGGIPQAGEFWNSRLEGRKSRDGLIPMAVHGVSMGKSLLLQARYPSLYVCREEAAINVLNTSRCPAEKKRTPNKRDGPAYTHSWPRITP